MVAAVVSGVCSTLPPECAVEIPCFRLSFRRRTHSTAPSCGGSRRRRSAIACSASRKAAEFDAAVPSTSSGGGGGGERREAALRDDVEDDLSHVIKFSMSDFKINDSVSIGLTSRADELIFEATVNDINSPLYNTKVVLRRLVSVQAKRRGRRAMEVLKRLVQRRIMYHSYSMQVYGYVCSSTTDDNGSFTLVHGYHGSFSLRHWLQRSDWLPTLEATLALDEESARKVGDDTVGGPAVSRQLRIIRILMRDLLIGVNYLHSHGLAHTELRLENLHISPVDKHVKVGILGNAADFDESSDSTMISSNTDRREMMIAFDMRCVGFIMAKMVLRELMDTSLFVKFKAFLNKGNDPSCLREFLLRTINRNSSYGSTGLQMLDRNWGSGWNLLSLLLAIKPSERISCLKALRHPFLCGPRWKVDQSMDMIRWGLGSTAVRITEEYIYNQQQRNRLAHLIELMEMLNPQSKPRHWLELLPGKWRLLYCTGRHIGLTLRQPPIRVLIGDVFLTVSKDLKAPTNFSFISNIKFTAIVGHDWPHNKGGVDGKLEADSLFRLKSGRRTYLKDKTSSKRFPSSTVSAEDSALKILSGKKWKKLIPSEKFPSTLPVVKLISNDVGLSMSLDEPLARNVEQAQKVTREVRTQIPPEMFDLSKIVCGTYVDSRLLVLRTVSGSALIFTRSCS